MQALQPLSSVDAVTPLDLPLEFFMNVLRLRQGVEESLYAARTGQELAQVSALANLRQRGLIAADRLQATELGWRFLNEVLAAFEH